MLVIYVTWCLCLVAKFDWQKKQSLFAFLNYVVVLPARKAITGKLLVQHSLCNWFHLGTEAMSGIHQPASPPLWLEPQITNLFIFVKQLMTMWKPRLLARQVWKGRDHFKSSGAFQHYTCRFQCSLTAENCKKKIIHTKSKTPGKQTYWTYA